MFPSRPRRQHDFNPLRGILMYMRKKPFICSMCFQVHAGNCSFRLACFARGKSFGIVCSRNGVGNLMLAPMASLLCVFRA